MPFRSTEIPTSRLSWFLRITLITATLASASVVWLGARYYGKPTDFSRARPMSLEKRRMAEHYESELLGSSEEIPPLARTRAIQQMNAMPLLSSAAGTWTFIGPAGLIGAQGDDPVGACTITRIGASGRILSLGFGNEGIYVGSAGGGVWKSTDGGAHWAPMSDHEVSIAAGALAVVATTGAKDTIYVGTGNGDLSTQNLYGQGILKSTDSGATWEQLAAKTFDRLSFASLKVDNLGGLKPGGTPVIPLTFLTENKFTFTVPSSAVPGPAYVQALNPPFVPFSSSGNAPGGAFTLK